MGPSSPVPKGAQPPIFGPCLSWSNGWLNQDATWYGGRPRPWRHLCVRIGPIPPKNAPTSRPIYCGRTAGWIKMPLGKEAGRDPGHIELDGDPARPRKKAHPPQAIFGPCLLWPNGWLNQDATWYGGKPRPRRRCVRRGRSFP